MINRDAKSSASVEIVDIEGNRPKSVLFFWMVGHLSLYVGMYDDFTRGYFIYTGPVPEGTIPMYILCVGYSRKYEKLYFP